MNFFTSLAAQLKGPLGQLGPEEMQVVAPAFEGVVIGVLTNPTKAGLISAAGPALVKVAVAQPQLLEPLIADLLAAIEQIGVTAPVVQPPAAPKA
jgi:hypothetical protein